MTIDEAETHFKSLYKLCQVLGITPQNITRWKRQGYLPLVLQYRISQITEGKLLPDEVDPKIVARLKKKT